MKIGSRDPEMKEKGFTPTFSRGKVTSILRIISKHRWGFYCSTSVENSPVVLWVKSWAMDKLKKVLKFGVYAEFHDNYAKVDSTKIDGIDSCRGWGKELI